MAKNRHTFAKRQREMEKKRKAEEKREKRRNKGKIEAEDASELENDAAERGSTGI
ncbi:MAG: hypothetical protein PVH91_01540 [Pseudomonadales bacterium]|jgi:hypothetical protein